MILFQKDWEKYPNAIIHYETSNPAFIRLAEVYYKMGIKNNAFHLALLHPELKNVNPYADDLDLTTQGKIVDECINNPWYFFREVLRIPVPGSLQPIPFKPDRANIALYWLFFNHIMTLIVIIRQTGKTTTLMSLVTYILNFGSANTSINLLTKSEGLKADTLSKVKNLFAEIPDSINFSTKKDIFNSDEVKISFLQNSFKASLSSSSPKQAEKVGRGFTAPITIIDETAFIDNIAIALGAILMSGNAAREYARQDNKLYGTIMATTSGNIDDRDGGYVYGLMSASTNWSESFFDCENEEMLNDLVLKNSNASGNVVKRPLVNISLSYRQLGYDEAWFQRKLSENISTEDNIRRDLYNMWTSGSTTSPISKEHLALLRTSLIEDPYTEFYSPYNYALRWYTSIAEVEYRMSNNGSFTIGVDTSDAVGRDDISFIMRDTSNGEVVCAAVFNEINLITLADFFVSFLIKYYASLMIIERRSSAAAIIDYMIQKLCLNRINPFRRLYNTIVQNKVEYEKEYEEVINAKHFNEDVFIKHKKHIGFVTSGSGITSRSELYSVTLTSMLKFTAHVLHDAKLINQISALIIKNNRIDHPSNGQDDCVIAALLSYWVLTNGKNLSIYGINTATILKNNNVYLQEKYANASDEYDSDEIAQIESEFNELLQLYKKERNEIISRQLEYKIRKVSSELSSYQHVVSVEDLLNQINQEKKLNKLC